VNPKPMLLSEVLKVTMRAMGTTLWIVKAPLSIAKFMLGITTTILGLKLRRKRDYNVLNSYKRYLLQTTIFDMTNTRNALGSSVDAKFDITSLYRIAIDYVEKLELDYAKKDSN